MDELLQKDVTVKDTSATSGTEAREAQSAPSSFENVLAERAKREDIERRKLAIRRIFNINMLLLPTEAGLYVSERKINDLNLFEIFSRILAIDTDEELVKSVPDQDKRDVVFRWLIDRIQGALPEGQKLTYAHLNDCFTNVSEEQLTAVIDQIALSGLTIKSQILG